MKNLSYSKKRMKRAVQLATIVAGVACASQELKAQTFTPTTGVWTVNGSTVTANGSSTSAYFKGTSSAYNITVNQGSNLSTTSTPFVIVAGAGMVNNSGAISVVSNVSGGPTVFTAGIYFNEPSSANATVINSGSVYAANTSGSATYGVLLFAPKLSGNANFTVVNSGTITAVGTSSAYAVFLHDAAGVGTVTNSGVITASAPGGAFGIEMENIPTTGTSTAIVTNTGVIQASSATNTAIGVSLNNREFGHGTGSSYATVNNNGTITAFSNASISGFASSGVEVARPAVVTINNGAQGVIQASATNVTAAGVYIIPNIITSNGTFSTYTATITNQGTIKGTSTNGSGYGILDISTNLLNVNNSGIISGSTTGILSTTGVANLNLDGGELIGTTGNSANIVTGAVNITGRTQLVAGSGTALVATGQTGQLNLNLVGGTPAQAAQVRAAAANTTGSFIFGGYSYSWQNFNVNLIQATSLELVCAPQYSDLATKIDNAALPLAYDVFYNEAVLNPNAALNTLSGFTIIEGTQDVEVNSQNSFISSMENQLESLDGLGGFSTANLTVGSSTLPGVNVADNQLTHLVAYADARMNGNTSNTVADNTTAGTDDPKDSKQMSSSPPPTEKWTVWLAGGVTLAHEDPLIGAPGFNAVNGSPMVGFDYAFDPSWKAGVFAGATIDGANFGDSSQVDANTELFGVYASWHHGGMFVDGFVAGGPSQYSDKRTTFAGTASADPDGYAIDLQSTIGYTVKINQHLNVTPEFGVQYSHMGVDNYTETGAGIFNTSVNKQDIDSFRTHLGGKMDGCFDITSDFKLMPEFSAAWYHEYLTSSRAVGAGLTGLPGFNFSVNTVTPDRDYALVGVGLNSIFTGIPDLPMGWFLNYDLQAGQSDYIQHNFTGGMRISF